MSVSFLLSLSIAFFLIFLSLPHTTRSHTHTPSHTPISSTVPAALSIPPFFHRTRITYHLGQMYLFSLSEGTVNWQTNHLFIYFQVGKMIAFLSNTIDDILRWEAIVHSEHNPGKAMVSTVKNRRGQSQITLARCMQRSPQSFEEQ